MFVKNGKGRQRKTSERMGNATGNETEREREGREREEREREKERGKKGIGGVARGE